LTLPPRRNSRIESGSDDAKSSIVGLSGWLFADLLLALAVVFLVASEPPADQTVGKPDDVYDIDVDFLLTPGGLPVQKTSQIDRPFDIWLRFSEPVRSESFDLSGISIFPNNQWTYQVINQRSNGSQQDFQLRLAPLRAIDTNIKLIVRKRTAQHLNRDTLFNREASLPITVTICRALTGIEVQQKETARFLIRGGLNMAETDLVNWLSSPQRLDEDTKDEYGDASLIYIETQKPMNERRQIGFVILFGGYNSNEEGADDGRRRANDKIEDIEDALRGLSLLPPRDLPTVSSQCPKANKVPVRPFGDGSISPRDLKFEIYFYTES